MRDSSHDEFTSASAEAPARARRARPGDDILYLDSAEVHAVLRDVDALAVVRRALVLHARGETILPPETALRWTSEDGTPARSLNMPAFVLGEIGAVGTKIINGCIGNPRRGLPRANGLTLLFDPMTARIDAVVAAAEISALRTACVSALAIEVLGPERPQAIALLGAGAIARAHVDLLVRRLPTLRTVHVYDISRAAATRLARACSPTVDAVAAPSAEEAVRRADVVVTATTAMAPYVRWDWLAPGSLTVNVSLDDLEPEVMLRADRVVVDDWQLVAGDDQRLLGRMYRAGLVVGPGERRAGARAVDSELGAVLAGRAPGRSAPDEIAVCNPFGLALEDVALAAEAVRVARATRRGTALQR